LFISFAPPKEPSRIRSTDYKFTPASASSPKANEPKKKRPEILTSAKTGACYTGLIGATVLTEVRAISGFALAPPIIEFRKIFIVFGFQTASKNFGKKRLF
jgi:hypothetical protein